MFILPVLIVVSPVFAARQPFHIDLVGSQRLGLRAYQQWLSGKGEGCSNYMDDDMY